MDPARAAGARDDVRPPGPPAAGAPTRPDGGAGGRPRLRAQLEALPVARDEGEPLYLLRDPWRLSERQLTVSLPALLLAGLLDGTRTLAEVQAEALRRHGGLVPLDALEELVAALEGALLLDGPHLARAVAAFRADPVRPAACVGSYPGEPAALRAFLDAQWTREGGPGAPPARPGERADAPAPAPVRGVISPHIDLHRGGHAYARAWRPVAEDCPAELFVVFGTSHTGTAPLEGGRGPAPRFALTRKDFATPLGVVPCDREAVDRLVAAYAGDDDLFAGEPHHRGEHSIEFQAVWLAHLFGGRRPVRLLPVLCGGLDDLAGAPGDDPRLAAFHEALARALAPLAPERVAFVAGIDLAHVGAQFHGPPVDEAALARVERADRETLRRALDLRCTAAVHEDLAAAGEARSVCGHAPLVSLLLALERAPTRGAWRGELTTWDRWWDGASAVSFAGAVFRDVSEPPPSART